MGLASHQIPMLIDINQLLLIVDRQRLIILGDPTLSIRGALIDSNFCVVANCCQFCCFKLCVAVGTKPTFVNCLKYKNGNKILGQVCDLESSA
jgi:hypothetical protein